MKWRALDGDGKPTLVDVVDRHGNVRRQHEGAWRPNLITDAGLDDWGTEWGYSDNAVRDSRDYLRVGTGSTEPAYSDTALDSEVQVSSTNGEESAQANTTIDSSLIALRYVASKRVTLNADRNLTEYGLSGGSATDLFVRELFRDELGDPVTISLLNGKILEVNHELAIDLPRSGIAGEVDIEEYDAANVLQSTTTYDLELGWVPRTSTVETGLLGLITPATAKAASNYVGYYALASGFSFPAAFSGTFGTSIGFTLDSWSSGAMTLSTYTPGSYTRSKTKVIPTTELNGIAYGFMIAFASSQSSGNMRSINGLAMRFDTSGGRPGTFEKLATNTLKIGYTLTWARASEGSGS